MMNKKIATILSVSALMLSSAQLLAADRDDASVTQDVKSRVTAAANVPTQNAPNIVVDTKEGKVTLSGMVDTSDQKDNAEKAAKAIDGAKSVKNEIMVKK